MNLRRFGITEIILVIALASAGVFLLLARLPAGRWLWLEALLVLLVVGILCWAAAQFYLYPRLARLQARIREAMAQRKLAAVEESNRPIQAIEQNLQELIAYNQTELEQLKALEHFRREFIGDVSHELKTPLFSIQGYLETLLDGAMEDSSVNKKFLKQASKNVQRLNNLVQDLLVLSQIEAGELQMKLDECKPYELLLDVADLLEFKMNDQGRSVKLVIQAGGNENVRVLADAERIRQVLHNLIDNAVIYGKPDGTVRASMSIEAGQLRISIADEGPGIAEEHLPHIFSRFYRVEKSRSRENGGTGLGLAIVKNLVEAHGSQILVSSQAGRGTQFSFGLQLVGR